MLISATTDIIINKKKEKNKKKEITLVQLKCPGISYSHLVADSNMLLVLSHNLPVPPQQENLHDALLTVILSHIAFVSYMTSLILSGCRNNGLHILP